MKLSNKCIILFVFPVLVSLFAACEEEEETIVQQQKPETFFFSCTINDDILVNESQPIWNVRVGDGAIGLGGGIDGYHVGSCVLEAIRGYVGENYSIEIAFSDTVITDTLTPIDTVLVMRDRLFKEATYPIRIFSTDDYPTVRDSLHLLIGFSITIRDQRTNEWYASDISYPLNHDKQLAFTQAINENQSQSSFIITKSQLVDSSYGPSQLVFSWDWMNTWYIEATLNCTLYKSGNIDNKLVLTNGVLRGCF